MRLRYIDLLKGFAILLMLFGHTMANVNSIHIWIYSFHMPLFFIVCGYLLHEKRNKEINLPQMITRRIYSIGIPYFIFGFILAIFYSMLNYLANEPIVLVFKLKKLFTLQGIDSLWFLPVYFLSELLVKVIYKQGKHEDIRSGLAVIISTILVSVDYEIWNIWYLNIIYKVLLGVIFIKVGIFISKYRIDEKIPLGTSYFLLMLGFILAQINGSVEMATNNIGNPLIYFPCAMFTSIALTKLFKNMDNIKTAILHVVEVYGKNSIVLLCTNNLLIEIIRLLDYKFTNNILLSLDMIGSIIFTGILMFIEWWIIKLANGPFTLFFGFKKNNK